MSTGEGTGEGSTPYPLRGRIRRVMIREKRKIFPE
jgi:hypothetical protein